MEPEISIEDIFRIFKKKSKVIISWAVMGLLLSSIYTFFIVTPKYISTSRIVVNQTQNSDQIITNTDIQTNLNLINTYQSIIKEPIILEDVIETTEVNLSVGELGNKISFQLQNNSLVFGVNVEDEDPNIASELANAITTNFEKKIGDILEVESVTILSEATPNMNAVSPNTIMNLLLGLIIGITIGVSLSFLSEFLDKRVKDSKIIEDLGWTNLGSVLEMTIGEIKETRIQKNNRKSISESTLRRRRV